MAGFIELMRKEGLKLIPHKPKRNHDAERRSLIKMAKVMTKSIACDTDKKIVVGMLTDGIFQREQISTGLASVEANRLPAIKQTKEHFYGRRQTAVQLVNMLIDAPDTSDEELLYFLIERSKVHHVTKAQNMKLRSFTANNPNVAWEEAYRACDVVLEPRLTQKRGRKSSG
jgi:hypothetical protein